MFSFKSFTTVFASTFMTAVDAWCSWRNGPAHAQDIGTANMLSAAKVWLDDDKGTWKCKDGYVFPDGGYAYVKKRTLKCWWDSVRQEWTFGANCESVRGTI